MKCQSVMSKRIHYETSCSTERYETISQAISAATKAFDDGWENPRVFQDSVDNDVALSKFCVLGYVDSFGRFIDEFLFLPDVKKPEDKQNKD